MGSNHFPVSHTWIESFTRHKIKCHRFFILSKKDNYFFWTIHERVSFDGTEGVTRIDFCGNFLGLTSATVQGTAVKNQIKSKLQNTSPNFWYKVQKYKVKVYKLEKKFHNVVFCKVKLSKMAPTKTNKIKNRQHFFQPIFKIYNFSFGTMKIPQL